MKIKITGKSLPKAQWNIGTIPDFNKLQTQLGIPNLKNLATVPFGVNDKRDQFGNTIQYDTKGNQIEYDWNGNPVNKKSTASANGDANKQTGFPQYDTRLASGVLGMASMLRGAAQDIYGNNIDDQYNKKLGMTDSLMGATPNKTSRGGFEFNTGLEGMFTTPVQYAGRPVTESTGYADYNPQSLYKAQKGVLIPENPTAFASMPMSDYLPQVGKPPVIPTRASNQNIIIPFDNNQSIDVDAALRAVATSESGSTPGKTALGKRTNLVGEGGKRASASGTYQITKDTLKQIYNKHFKDIFPSFSSFNTAVDSDSNTEYAAAKALMTDHINDYGIYGIGAWYYPQYAAKAAQGDMSVWNKIPRQDYGNKITWGQDFMKKLNLYKKYSSFEEGGVTQDNTTAMKIKITKTPEGAPKYADGGRTVGDQMGYGLYRGQGVRDFNAFTEPETEVRSVYPEVDRKDANIEVEKGEKIIAKDGLSIFDVPGNKHSKGGTPVNAEPGSYVVSDFIVAPKILQAKMGFEISSDKKTDNTWAKVLDSKVKSKDYNRLSQILQQAQKGVEVDPYELKTAQVKFPVYQDYVSKAALGGELSKALEGKDYEIPDLGMAALQKMQGNQEQQMPQQGGIPEQPQMGVGGHVLPMYQQQPGTVKTRTFKTDEGDISAGFFPSIPPEYNIPVKFGEGNIRIQKRPGTPAIIGTTKVPGAIGGGAPDKEWRNKIISFLQQGATPKEVAAAGHGTEEGITKQFGKYYKPKVISEAVTPAYAYTEEPAQTKELKVYTPGTAGDNGTSTTGGGNNNTGDNGGNTGSSYNSNSGGNTNSGGSSFGRIPFEEDLLKESNALADMYSYHNVPPWQAKFNPAYINPRRINTDYANRLVQSQAKTAMEDASLYGGSPQAQAARAAQINAQTLPTLGQSALQTNIQNVSNEAAAEQYNNQIYNTAAQANALADTTLSDKNMQYIYNVDKSRVMGRDRFVNARVNELANSGKAYLWNQRFPQMAFNPLSYEVAFKPGSGKSLYDQSYGDAGGVDSFPVEQVEAIREQMRRANITPTDENIMKWLERSQPKIRRSYSPYGTPGNYSTTQYGDYAGGGYPMPAATSSFAQGGYIPEYNVGGWM